MMMAFGTQVAGQISVIAIYQVADYDFYWKNGGMDNAKTAYED